jgi:hypothetical protein
MAPRSIHNRPRLSKATAHQKLLSSASSAATRLLTQNPPQPHTMRHVLRTIQDHHSVPTTQRAHISAPLSLDSLKPHTIVTRQTYLYHAKTVTMWFQTPSNQLGIPTADDTAGSTGEESTASPLQPSGSVEGRSTALAGPCSSLAAPLRGAR